MRYVVRENNNNNNKYSIEHIIFLFLLLHKYDKT